MDPILLQTILGATQTAGGLIGRLMADRPTNEIPEALRQSLALAKARVANPYSEGYSAAKDQLDLQQSNALAAAQQSGNPQESIAQITGASERGARQLQAQNEASQEQDIQDLTRVLSDVQRAQEMQFQYNEQAPFLDQFRESSDVFGAGMENLYGALDTKALLGAYGSIGGTTPSAPASPAINPGAAVSGAGNVAQAIAGGVSMEELQKILQQMMSIRF